MNRIFEKLKDKLSGAALWAVWLLLQALLIVIIFAPLVVIDISWILRFIILIAVWGSMRYMPTISSIARLALWIISLWYIQGIPTLWGRIYYFVCAGLYVIFEIIPFLLNLFTAIFPGGVDMKIQPRHFNPALAPMKYYKFLIWFAIPVGVLGNIFSTARSISQYLSSEYPLSTVVNGISFGTLMGIDVFFCLLCIILNIAALILLRRMDWRGVLALCGFYLAAAMYSGACVYIYAALGGDYGMYIGRIIVFPLWGLLTWVYFCRRRPLFHTKQTQPPVEKTALSPDWDADEGGNEMNTQLTKEQDDRIAGLNIPNSDRPGNYFNGVDELQEYSDSFRKASASSHQSESATITEDPAAPLAELVDNVENEANSDAEENQEARFLVVDKATGEVVAESAKNPFGEPHIVQPEPKKNIFRRALESATSTKIILVIIVIAVLVAVWQITNESVKKGYEKGYEDGYTSGESDNYDEAYAKGYSVGFDNAYENRTDYNDGYWDGYEEGIYDGEFLSLPAINKLCYYKALEDCLKITGDDFNNISTGFYFSESGGVDFGKSNVNDGIGGYQTVYELTAEVVAGELQKAETCYAICSDYLDASDIEKMVECRRLCRLLINQLDTLNNTNGHYFPEITGTATQNSGDCYFASLACNKSFWDLYDSQFSEATSNLMG